MNGLVHSSGNDDDTEVPNGEPERLELEPHRRSVAGVLGPPPRRPDPGRSWDDLVGEAAVADTSPTSDGPRVNRPMTTTDPTRGPDPPAEVTAP
jgi:hypothetical protein